MILNCFELDSNRNIPFILKQCNMLNQPNIKKYASFTQYFYVALMLCLLDPYNSKISLLNKYNSQHLFYPWVLTLVKHGVKTSDNIIRR